MHPSRRDFLAQSAAIGALGIGVETARGYQANDTIRVACIGTGGRCRGLMKSLAALPGVKITGVCDINEANLDAGRKLADPKAVATRHFRELLDRTDIDAVLIATPDHWHVPITVAACAAGKDVYVEKPLTHNIDEGKAVVDAQNTHKRVVQVGMQQRSMTHLIEAKGLVDAGKLGRVFKVHLTWNRNAPQPRRQAVETMAGDLPWKDFLGNAPDQPVDLYKYRQWRWFWDFGGGIFTDLMVHFIDVAHWFLGLDHPLSAAAIGSSASMAGSWQTPDTVQCLLAYPKDIQIYFEGTFSNARNRAMMEFMGTEATLYADRGRFEVHPEDGKTPPTMRVLGTDPRRGLDFYDQPDAEGLHLADWLGATRARTRPRAPAEAGVSAAGAAHLANLALRRGQVAIWPG